MASETPHHHVMVFPFPLQGHINPMLQFSKRLASRGLKITFLTTTTISKTTQSSQPTSPLINTDCISDGHNQGDKVESLDAYLERFNDAVSQSLPQLIQKLQKDPSNIITNPPPKVLVYDSVMPWILDIAQGLGLRGASFFTQSCAVNAIYYHLHRGHFEIPVEAAGSTRLSLPAMPMLESRDLPSFVCDVGSYAALLRMLRSQFSNYQDADWVLFNTFDKLEQEVVKWMASTERPIYTSSTSPDCLRTGFAGVLETRFGVRGEAEAILLIRAEIYLETGFGVRGEAEATLLIRAEIYTGFGLRYSDKIDWSTRLLDSALLFLHGKRAYYSLQLWSTH